MFRLKKKYIAVFLLKERGSYSINKIRRFNPTEKIIRFQKGKACLIDINNHSFSRGLKLYYFIDIEQGQLQFKKEDKKRKSKDPKIIKAEALKLEMEKTYNPKYLDSVIKGSLIKQLTSSLREKINLSRILDIGLGIIVGVAVGILIGGYMP